MKNGSKICFWVFSFIPTPLSSTSMTDVRILRARAHRDEAAHVVAHRLAGVHEEVDEDLLDLLGVAGERGKALGEIELDVGVLVDLVVDEPRARLDERVDVDRVDEKPLVLAGERPEPLDDPLDPLRAVVHVVDERHDVLAPEIVVELRDLEVGVRA